MFSKSASLLAAAAALLVSGVSHAANPVSATYYRSWSENPATGLTFSDPFFSETLPDINFDFSTAPAGHPSAADVFAARFTGSISAPSAGAYNFTFGSDDAGYLFIDGALIGALPGTHSYAASIFPATLSAGSHSLEVQYYNTFCCGSVVTLKLDPAVTFDPPATDGVPEPATWAMMIAGFGLVGGTMRRRRTGEPVAA